MIRYALRAAGAHLRGGRTLFLLAVAGVALGVGSVLSIQILNQSALGAFAGGVRAISGEAQLSVVGTGPALPDALLPEVLAVPGVRQAIPIERVDVAVEGGGTLEVVGTDLFAPVRARWDVPLGELGDVLARSGWVAVSPELAQRMGWRRGSTVVVSSGSRRVRLEIGALVDFRKVAPLASTRLAVMDLAQAQALLGAPGRLTQIDVIARPGVDPAELARRLSARLGAASVRVITPEQRVAEADALLAAFRLNLTALSLVSLLVGGFLVHASTQAALVRRREELGVLRCLGATRGQVVALVLADATLLGVLGTALGIPLGWIAARANVEAVGATVRTLYLLEGIERVTLSPALVALGIVLGLLGALAGAVLPALDVAREDPRTLLSRGAPDRAPLRSGGWLAGAGAALVAVSAALVRGPLAGWPYAGFVLALAVLGAVPLCVPLLLATLARVRRPARLGVRYGARDVGYLRSTAVAAGALAVAVSMLAGITVMIASFRQTVDDWLGATLRADVYVTTPSWRRGGRSESSLEPRIVAALAGAPEVRAVDRLRQVYAEVEGTRIPVSGIDAALRGARGRVQLVDGADAGAALDRLAREPAVLVSEPLARKRALRAGGSVEVRSRSGPVRLAIAGVYRDYGAEQGAVLMDLRRLDEVLGPGPLTNVALYLQPGTDADATVTRLRTELSGDALLIRSNRRLRHDVLAVFEQTFAVTRLLQGMSLLVAVSGVALSLLVLARERSSEVALYRALGAVRGQVFRLFVGRALGIAVVGELLGAVGGAGLALVLVEVINPASFGWSIALHWPWRTLAGQAGVLLVAALAASVYPALRASATPATELSRDAL